MELKVIKPFRDKENHEKIYKVDEVLNVEELDRVNDLVSRGLCVITALGSENSGSDDDKDKVKLFDKEFDLKAVKDAIIAIGVSIAPNAGIAGVSKKITELTDEQTKAIKEILCKE